MALFVATPLLSGGTNPDCDDRVLIWQGGTNRTFTQAGTDAAELPTLPADRQTGWYGDDLSRMVFYSWPEGAPDDSITALRGAAGAVVAWDRAWKHPWQWPGHETAGGRQEFTLPQACDDHGCGAWKHARSLDIGYCSVEIPNATRPGPGAVATEFLEDSGLYHVAFADDTLEGILDAIDNAPPVENDDFIGKRTVHTRRMATGDPSRWWVSTDGRNDEVCFDVRFEARSEGVMNCGWRWVRVGVCGYVDLDDPDAPVPQLTWYATRSAYARESTGVGWICNAIRTAVAQDVEGRLTRNDDHADGPNEITAALRELVAPALTIWADQLNGIDGLPIVGCTKPGPFPGNADRLCELQLLGAMPTGCVGVPGSGVGQCVHRIPIQRVARGPSGFDVVLSDHRSPDTQATGLASVVERIPLTGAGIASSFRNFHCAAPPGEPITASSRLHERIFRQDETHIFQASGWTSLD